MEKNQKYRKITFYKNYFQDFFNKQDKKVKEKIIWTFELVEDLQRVPKPILNTLKTQMGFMKYEFNWEAIFLEFSVFLTKGNWLF